MTIRALEQKIASIENQAEIVGKQVVVDKRMSANAA
jgi:hypothetical protein